MMLLKLAIFVFCIYLAHSHLLTIPKNYLIRTKWNGELLNSSDSVHLNIKEAEDMSGVEINIKAPFYNDPKPPNATYGEAYYGLWDYEVVEAFFLADSVKYLELEFGPHGQHLGLILNGRRNAIADSFPMKYEAKIEGKMWSGKAIIPKKYFPSNVNRFNAYAIDGVGDERNYKALYPNYFGTEPDFHYLEAFLPFDGLFINNLNSEFWAEALQNEE